MLKDSDSNNSNSVIKLIIMGMLFKNTIIINNGSNKLIMIT